MTTIYNRDQTIVLTNHTQWIKWIAQLENKCVPLSVWHLFDTKQLSQPLVEPRAVTRPEVDAYQPSTAAINAYTTQYQSEHPLSATSPPFVPTRVSDLSNTGKASYKEDVEDYKGRIEAYKMEDTKYQRERNHLAQVTDFMRTTVSAHLFTNCCKPSQPYRDWITKLAATVGVRAEDELDEARRYHEAMKPMRVVTQWDTWLTEVDHAVTEGRATGVPECLNDQFIKKDFVSSVSKHFSTWTTSFIVHGLRDPTVTATEMFLQFRQNAQLMHPAKSRSNKAAFAAGGPTLDNEEPDNEKKRGRGRNMQKRQHPYGGGSTSSQKCKACDGFHTLSKCWYAFPDTAPEGWQPRDHITKMVKNRISNTPDLEDDVRSSKRPRSRTPVIKKSQSATPTIEPTSEEYPLERSFILDSGTTCHVGNDIERFTNTREPGQGDFLWAGNARVWIKAYGTVVIRVQGDCPTRLLHLYDVAYCPDLHCNLVSFRILRQQGLWWDTKSNPTVLRRRNDAAIATLQERYGQWVIEYNDVKQPQEIQLWIRTVELPPSPQEQNSETDTFYEDEAVSDSQGPPEQPQYDKAGRKRIPYPTPPSTPPAAFIAQWMSSVGYEQLPPAAAGSSDEGQDPVLPHSRRIQTLGMDLLRKTDRAKPVDHRVSLLSKRDRLRSPLNALSLATVAEPRIAAYKADPTARNVRRHPAYVAEPWAAAFIAGLLAGNVQSIEG
ncbi:hypothetical protein Alg215_11305, partial [Pyrenophora tritici-repentis]